MSYYLSTTVDTSFDRAIELVTEALGAEGFGVLTDIDVKATMKKKLDVEYRNYRILGACNPPFAHKALAHDDKIGVLLPCNVIVQEWEPGRVEISAVDPLVSMQVVESTGLETVATEVRDRLSRVVQSLAGATD
jgi:uncharacterized protein (DUF302 family)